MATTPFVSSVPLCPGKIALSVDKILLSCRSDGESLMREPGAQRVPCKRKVDNDWPVNVLTRSIDARAKVKRNEKSWRTWVSPTRGLRRGSPFQTFHVIQLRPRIYHFLRGGPCHHDAPCENLKSTYLCKKKKKKNRRNCKSFSAFFLSPSESPCIFPKENPVTPFLRLVLRQINVAKETPSYVYNYRRRCNCRGNRMTRVSLR